MKKVLQRLDKVLIILLLLSFIFFYKLFLNPLQMIFPAQDTVSVYYHYKSFLRSSVFLGNGLPLWDPYFFSGMPFLANSESAVFSLQSIIYLLFPVYFAFGFNYFIDVFLIGTFTYLFARLIKLTRTASFFSAIITMFSGPVIILIYPGHIFIANTITWFPLLLHFFELSFLKNRLIYGLFSGVIFGFMAVSGHFQIAFYAFVVCLFYLILRLVFSRDRKKIKLLFIPAITVIIAFFLFAVQLIPSLELLRSSNRATGVPYVFASDFSLPPKQLLSFVFPNFFGNPVVNNYWGKGNFWSLCGYLGIIPLFFAFFALVKKGHHFTYIFFALSLFALFFSFGSYSFIFPFFYKYLPLFNNFRVPARFLFFYAFSVAILAGIGFDLFLKSSKKLPVKLGRIILFSGLFLFFLTIIFNQLPQKLQFFERYLVKDNYAVNLSREILLKQITVDIIVFCLILILFSLLLLLKDKCSQKILNYSIFTLVIFNLWFYWQGYYATKPMDDIYPRLKIIEEIKKDHSLFRVFDKTGMVNANAVSNGLETLGGISSAIPANYKPFFWNIGTHSDNKNDVHIDIKKIKNITPLMLLNVKYIIADEELGNNDLELLIKDEKNLYRIRNFLPRAYLVPNATNVKTQSEALSAINKASFNPKDTLFIHDYKSVMGNQEFKEVKINSKTADKIMLADFTSQKAVLVLSQPFYPGWKAFDYGREIKLYKGNGLLTAAPLAVGKHSILFVYRPFSYEIGKYLSFFTAAVLIIIVYAKRRKIKNYLHL